DTGSPCRSSTRRSDGRCAARTSSNDGSAVTVAAKTGWAGAMRAPAVTPTTQASRLQNRSAHSGATRLLSATAASRLLRGRVGRPRPDIDPFMIGKASMNIGPVQRLDARGRQGKESDRIEPHGIGNPHLTCRQIIEIRAVRGTATLDENRRISVERIVLFGGLCGLGSLRGLRVST